MQPRSITIVTQISGTGIVPKHANGKFSLAKLFRETLMPLGKKFFRKQLRLRRVPRRTAHVAAPASRARSFPLPVNTREAGLDQKPGAGSRAVISSNGGPRVILAAGFGLISRAVMRCAVCADLAFTNLPLAVLSWLMTQFFVGCAAYAEAMYPSVGYATSCEVLGPVEPAEGRPAEGDHLSLSPQLVPDLAELSASAIGTIGSGGSDNIVWLNVTRKAPSRRIASTALLVTRWLSRRRGAEHARPVTIELRTYDRWTQRGDPMPRYGTE
jgi:hypothetical protein